MEKTTTDYRTNKAFHSPPNLRTSADYSKQPRAPRCFNCEWLQEDQRLDFYCSKYMVRVKVYELCDGWKSNGEQQMNPLTAFLHPRVELQERNTDSPSGQILAAARAKAIQESRM